MNWLTSEQGLLHNKAWKTIKPIEEFITDPKFLFLQVSEFEMPDCTNPDEISQYNHVLDFLLLNIQTKRLKPLEKFSSLNIV